MSPGRIYTYLRSNVLGLVAILIALSGTAVAANTAARDSVTSKSIKNETVKGVDVRDGALTGGDLGDDSLTGADIAEATLQVPDAGPSGPAGGALTGTYPNPQLAAPGIGARAFGHVAPDGTLTASKNASVSHPANGIYCVTPAASVTEPRVLIAAIDDAGGGATTPGTGNVGFALGHVTNTFLAAPCPVGTHQVTTLVYNGDQVDDDDGGGNSAGGLLVLDDEPFTFVIP